MQGRVGVRPRAQRSRRGGTPTTRHPPPFRGREEPARTALLQLPQSAAEAPSMNLAMTSRAALLVASLITLAPAHAAPCPNNADALGTARVLDVDAAATARVGRKQFPQTLPLAPKEVVLTFD